MPKQSPLFSKTYDFILWLLNHTEKFPKSERFRMGKRLEDTAFAFYETLMIAVRSQDKQMILSGADLELNKLRLYIRLSRDRNLTNPRQYQYAAERLTEIGKLLGGWLKTLAPTG
jgi:hypothetical protein